MGLLANPTCRESATGENIVQLLEEELRYCTCSFEVVPAPVTVDFICSAAAQKRYGQISICY